MIRDDDIVLALCRRTRATEDTADPTMSGSGLLRSWRGEAIRTHDARVSGWSIRTRAGSIGARPARRSVRSKKVVVRPEYRRCCWLGGADRRGVFGLRSRRAWLANAVTPVQRRQARWRPPVPATEQPHRRGNEDRANQGGIDNDADDHADADQLRDHDLAGGERGRHDDQQQRRRRDDPSRALQAGGDRRLAELGGYDDDNPITADVQSKLTDILQDLELAEPDLRVLTGLGLGAEQLAATAAAGAGVPYMAVLSFPGQETAWPQARRAAYGQLLAGAAATLTLSAQTPAGGPEVGRAIGQRNVSMVTRCHAAIVVWDGHNATLGGLVRDLQRRIP